MGKVEIQVGGVFVGHIELKTLVRFSQTAAIAFPKPPRTKSITSTPPTSSEKKIMNLDNEKFWRLPSPQAVQFVLNWMRNASKTRRGDVAPNCTFPEDSETEFGFRCEVYAATLLFDIRPRQFAIRRQLIDHITNTPPTLVMLQTVHELLPIDDVIMTRTVTAYFEHVEPTAYKADPMEDFKIQTYVTDPEVDFELFKRFEDIQNARLKWKQHQELKARKLAEKVKGPGRRNGRRTAGEDEE